MQKENNKSERSSISNKKADYNITIQYNKPKTSSERCKKNGHSKGKSKFLNINLSHINNINEIDYNNKDSNEPNKEFYQNFLISLKLDNVSYNNDQKNKSRASISSTSSHPNKKAFLPVGKEFNQKIRKINLSTCTNKDQVSTTSKEKRKGSNLTNDNNNNTNANVNNIHTNHMNSLHQQGQIIPQLQLSSHINNNNNTRNSPILKKSDHLIEFNRKNYISKRSVQVHINSKLGKKDSSFENLTKKDVYVRQKSLPKQTMENVIQYQTYQTGVIKTEIVHNQHKTKKKKFFWGCIPCLRKKDND